MNAKEIQGKMEELHYWDAEAIKLECNYFADEITLVYDDSSIKEKSEVIYHFSGCYKSSFNHWVAFAKDKPVRELSTRQISYSLKDIEVDEIEIEGEKFLHFKIWVVPMEIEIWCKDIEIHRNLK